MKTHKNFSAETALRIGLVSEVVKATKLDSHIETFVDTLSKNAPIAIREAKKLIQYVSKGPLTEDIVRETASKIADRRASLEGIEGVSAFIEKRKPVWPIETNNVKDLVDGDSDV